MVAQKRQPILVSSDERTLDQKIFTIILENELMTLVIFLLHGLVHDKISQNLTAILPFNEHIQALKIMNLPDCDGSIDLPLVPSSAQLCFSSIISKA